MHAKTRDSSTYSCKEPLHKASTVHFGRCQLTNTHSGPRCGTICTRVLSSPKEMGQSCSSSQQLGLKAFPSWGQQSTGHHCPSNLLPHLVPGKPPHLQQLRLHGGVKNPVALQRKPRRFCAPAVPSCALGTHCRDTPG